MHRLGDVPPHAPGRARALVVVGAIGRLRAAGAELGDVGPGGERPPSGAGHHDHADRVVGLPRLDDRADGLLHGQRQHVVAGRVVEREAADRAVDLGEQQVGPRVDAHASIPFVRSLDRPGPYPGTVPRHKMTVPPSGTSPDGTQRRAADRPIDTHGHRVDVTIRAGHRCATSSCSTSRSPAPGRRPCATSPTGVPGCCASSPRTRRRLMIGDHDGSDYLNLHRSKQLIQLDLARRRRPARGSSPSSSTPTSSSRTTGRP